MRRGLLFAMLTVLLLAASGVQAAEPERLSYEDFLQNVQDGRVKSVTLGPLHYVSGTYLQGKVQTEFFSQRPLDAGNAPLLNKLLETHEVSVVRKEPPKPSTVELLTRSAPELLLLLVPSVLLVFVIVYVLRINKKIDQVIIR